MTENTTTSQVEESGSNPDSRIWLDLVNNQTKKFNFDQIVKNYHTYKPTTDMVGRSINWLIRKGHKIIGAVGVGSSIMALKSRDSYIGWKKEQRLKNLVHTCTNWRFCLMEHGHGSQVIKLLIHHAKKEWHQKFGDKLVLMETLVEPPYKGTCYLASGFKPVGKTKGLQFEWKNKEDVTSQDQVVQKWMKFGTRIDYSKWKVVTGTNKSKIIFVKPLHRYWKKTLNS